MLKKLKKEDESFSEDIRSLIHGKDISICYGLLAEYAKDMEIVEKEALKARRGNWRSVEL